MYAKIDEKLRMHNQGEGVISLNIKDSIIIMFVFLYVLCHVVMYWVIYIMIICIFSICAIEKPKKFEWIRTIKSFVSKFCSQEL